MGIHLHILCWEPHIRSRLDELVHMCGIELPAPQVKTRTTIWRIRAYQGYLTNSLKVKLLAHDRIGRDLVSRGVVEVWERVDQLTLICWLVMNALIPVSLQGFLGELHEAPSVHDRDRVILRLEYILLLLLLNEIRRVESATASFHVVKERWGWDALDCILFLLNFAAQSFIVPRTLILE